MPTQRTYVSNLSDSLTTGVGSLADANMNEAATKLAAFEVQQRFGHYGGARFWRLDRDARAFGMNRCLDRRWEPSRGTT